MDQPELKKDGSFQESMKVLFRPNLPDDSDVFASHHLLLPGCIQGA